MHVNGSGHPLRPAWRMAGTGRPLDEWLAEQDAPPLADRLPVLAYGSNANPSKITWLRSALGLAGPVIVLRADCSGLAAVWASGLRERDGQRPATIAATPGPPERHAVWLATPAQLAVLDVCEGRGHRYDLARLHSGTVTLEDGTPVADPLAYVGAGAQRMPLLVGGRPVRCADIRQADALGLRGTPARTHGLRTTVLA